MKAVDDSPYPYKVHITRSIDNFRNFFDSQLQESGQELKQNIEAISGRVLSIRRSGASLIFLVIEEERSQLQVYCNKEDCAAIQ